MPPRVIAYQTPPADRRAMRSLTGAQLEPASVGAESSAGVKHLSCCVNPSGWSHRVDRCAPTPHLVSSHLFPQRRHPASPWYETQEAHFDDVKADKGRLIRAPLLDNQAQSINHNFLW